VVGPIVAGRPQISGGHHSAHDFSRGNATGTELGRKTLVKSVKILVERKVPPRPAASQINQPRIRLIIARAIQFVDHAVERVVHRLRGHAFVSRAPYGNAGVVSETFDAVLRITKEKVRVHGGVVVSLRIHPEFVPDHDAVLVA
jgi:hypothetical protein